MNGNSRDSLQVRESVRKIGTTRRSVSGTYMFRGETPIQFESTLERDFLIRKAFSRSVLNVVSQPIRIPFQTRDGRNFHYTPDFLVYYRLGSRDYLDYPLPMLVEVKPESEWQARWRDWLPKWKAAYRYAREQGWLFKIQDESRIRDQALRNIKFLERFSRMSFPETETGDLIQNLSEMGSAPVHYLLSRHYPGIYRPQGLAHIWHLLATQKLECDMSRLLNDTTTVWVTADE